MKNKREFFIAGMFFLVGIAISYFLLQNKITSPQIAQPSEIKSKQTTLTPNSLNSSLEAAVELIEQEGYTVIDGLNAWQEHSRLNALIGACSGSEGYCKKTFFFYDGKYLGTDTSDPSSQISFVWRDDNTIALNYVLYHKQDPMCCPTAGAATVRFKWDGNKLVALDPIPPLGLSADVHR